MLTFVVLSEPVGTFKAFILGSGVSITLRWLTFGFETGFDARSRKF